MSVTGFYIALALFSFVGLIGLGRWLHNRERILYPELTDEEFNARLRGDL